MSIAISTDDQVSPGLQALMAHTSPQRVAAEVGPRCTRMLQRHFLQNGDNKRGWPTTHFWARAAKATNWQPREDGLDIVCNQIGVRQRFYGGVIRPVKAKALTIPLTGKAYGHVASDFPGSFLMVTKKGAFIAQHTAAFTAKGNVKKQKSTIEVLFRLAASVTQNPDPTVLPDDEAFGEVLDKSVDVLMRRRS